MAVVVPQRAAEADALDEGRARTVTRCVRSWGDAVLRTNDATRDSGRRGGAAR